MSEMGSHDPFEHLKHKLWSKERSGVKLVVWPLNVKNRPSFFTWRWHETYHCKALNKGYNFASNLIVIRGLHAKLWAPKVVGVRVVGILRLPLGSPRTKCHLDVGIMKRHKVYYKGEGGGLPPSSGCGESCESEVAHGLS
jgi:hypothetical protein